MNEFAKRMTMGFVVALLVAGLIGYGGMKKKALPLYADEFGQQSMCAVFIQDLKAFSVDADDYYSCINFPLSIAVGSTDDRPF